MAEVAGIVTEFSGLLSFEVSLAKQQPRRVQKYKRTLRPERRAVAEFIYHYHGKRNHQGLGNAFVFLDTTLYTSIPKRPGVPILSSFVFLDTTGSMTGSARSEDSMGRQPRSMPRRYETYGAARTALERIYSGSRTIVITK